MTAALEVFGARHETHLLYALSWANERAMTHGSVAVVDADGRADGIERARAWLPSLGGKIEFADHVPTTADCVDRVYIGSPAARQLIRWTAGRRHDQSIVVDEGLGSYGNATTRFRALRREGASLASAATRTTVRATTAALSPAFRWPTYRPDVDQTWKLNESVAATFRAVAEPALASSEVVLLTQPWSELRLATADDVRRIVSTIAAIVDQAGLRLVIRPHPRERNHPYGDIPTLDHGLPAELQPRVRGARLVVGDTSTALLHLASMFDVPALRLIGFADRGQLNATQSSLLAHYLGDPMPLSGLSTVLRRIAEAP